MKTATLTIWKFLANLGDATPLLHGGFFVYTDTTGIYPPEAELLIEPSDEMDVDSKKARWTVYRIIIEPCTFQNGILSDNKFHPDYPVWFAKDLASMADTYGQTKEGVINMFISEDLYERANAWRMVGEYFGWENLDSYPYRYTKEEIESRYTDGEI